MSHKLLSKSFGKMSVISIIFLCLFSIISLQLNRVREISESTLPREVYLKQERSKDLRLSLIKEMPTFGFDNLIASWAMLEFMQYFGDDKARKVTGHSLSDDYLEVISNTDPRFARAYMFISPVSSMFGGTPERTVQLLDKALEYLSPEIPEAYYVWIYKGTDEILFFGDLKKAKKSYEKALEWAKIAEDEKIIKSASNTIEFLASNPDTTKAQVGIWFQVWVNNKEKIARDMAKEKIEQLGGELKIYPNGRVEAIPPKANKP